MEENEKIREENEKINPEDIIFDDEADTMPEPDTYDYNEAQKNSNTAVNLKMNLLFKYAFNECLDKLPYNMDTLTNSQNNKIKVADLRAFVNNNFENVITVDNMNLIISFIAAAPNYAVASFMVLIEKHQSDLWTLIKPA